MQTCIHTVMASTPYSPVEPTGSWWSTETNTHSANTLLHRNGQHTVQPCGDPQAHSGLQQLREPAQNAESDGGGNLVF